MNASIDDADGERKVLPLAEAHLTVDVDAVVLDGQVVLERHFGAKQLLQRHLGFT